jgi:hypothetical protein
MAGEERWGGVCRPNLLLEEEMTRVGVIFEIPVSDGRAAYGQYVIKDKMGPIIQVFNLITRERPDLDTIIGSGPMFPPVITGLYAALRTGLWVSIGYEKVQNFNYPGFISTFYDEKSGEASIWFYWDGEKYIKLGTKLPEEYKSKEYLMGWDPHTVVQRIETGEYPFPYRDLILYNRYTPRK